MSKFEGYYNSEIEKYGGIRNYINGKAKEKTPLLKRILKYSMKNKTILEAGCGSAANSIYLANNNRNVTCIDKDEEMLNLARKNSKLFKNKPNFLKKDIFELNNGNFDVSFSHGVLEHYQDSEIIDLVNSQLKSAEYVVVSIPSNFFKQEQAINGDERFLSKGYWNKILNNTNGIIVENFSYFYDSDLTRIKLLKILAKITFNILPSKKPYLGFVLRRKENVYNPQA